MRPRRSLVARTAWTLLLVGCAQAVEPTKSPTPTRASPPFLILHDWFGRSPVPTPSFIRDHRDFLDARPFDGLAVYLRSPDQAANLTTNILSGKAVTYEEMVDVLAPLKGLDLRNLKENFAAVVGGAPPDFMEDWSVPVGNFARLARAAREFGLRGIYFDNEAYEAPWSDYPDGVFHRGKSLREYQDQARLRGRQVMEAMVAKFPDITVILLHGPYISEPGAPAPLFPRWQSRNELVGPFFSGFVEGAGSRATVVDGGELYHLRTDEQFRRSYEWRRDGLPSAQVDCAFVPAAIRTTWSDRVSLAFGVYDRPFKGNAMNPETLAATLTRALRRTDRYVWLYVEGPTFLKPPVEGGAPADWVEAVWKGRQDEAGDRSR